jgi:hypothetical protein
LDTVRGDEEVVLIDIDLDARLAAIEVEQRLRTVLSRDVSMPDANGRGAWRTAIIFGSPLR